MEVAMEKFAVGNNVVWQEDMDILNYRRKKWGEGPFCIIKVERVPVDECACGDPLGNCFFHPYDGRYCGQTVLEAVGHTQWITIEDLRGGSHTFSGAFLKKLRYLTIKSDFY